MKKELFGKVNGREVYLYTLENSHGMKVTVSSFGALIIRIWAPDHNGNFADVALGYDRLEQYLVNFTVQSLHRMRTGSAVQNSPSKEKPTSCLSTTMAITCTVTELWVGISGSGMPKKKKTAFYSRCL